MPDPKEIIAVAGRQVAISNPGKLYFPGDGITKLDVVRYYLAVADGALRGVAGRPMVLKRYVHGAEGEAFFQKRAPSSRPPWIETVELRFPSGRTAEEIVVTDAAGLAWVATSAASTSTRTRCARRTSSTPTSSESTSTRCLAFRISRFSTSPW
jgi:DNA primase